MEKIFDIKQLLQKPIAMMTGEELAFLIGSSMEPKANEATPIVQKRTYYGIEGIAQVFGCSVPTANRIRPGTSTGKGSGNQQRKESLIYGKERRVYSCWHYLL